MKTTGCLRPIALLLLISGLATCSQAGSHEPEEDRLIIQALVDQLNGGLIGKDTVTVHVYQGVESISACVADAAVTVNGYSLPWDATHDRYSKPASPEWDPPLIPAGVEVSLSVVGRDKTVSEVVSMPAMLKDTVVPPSPLLVGQPVQIAWSTMDYAFPPQYVYIDLYGAVRGPAIRASFADGSCTIPGSRVWSAGTGYLLISAMNESIDLGMDTVPGSSYFRVCQRLNGFVRTVQ